MEEIYYIAARLWGRRGEGEAIYLFCDGAVARAEGGRHGGGGDEADLGEGGGEEEQDEEEEVRVSIGLDPTLDREVREK